LIKRGLDLVAGSEGDFKNGILDETTIKEIELMIEMIVKLYEVPEEEICCWEEKVIGDKSYRFLNYHESVGNFFASIPGSYWEDRHYTEKIASLNEQQVAEMDLDEIRALITWTWRVERFCDGARESAIVHGQMRSIQERLMEILATMAT